MKVKDNPQERMLRIWTQLTRIMMILNEKPTKIRTFYDFASKAMDINNGFKEILGDLQTKVNDNEKNITVIDKKVIDLKNMLMIIQSHKRALQNTGMKQTR